MSRTVAERRFHRRAMTSVSSGPRNFSSAFSGLRRRRRSGRLTPRLSRSPPADGNAPAPQQTRMTLGEAFPPVGERDVELDDEMPVTRLVNRAAGALPALDDTGERERRKLPLGIALLDAGPDRRTLWGVLAERERVEETKPAGIGDPLERRRTAFVLFVARALEPRGVAREEVQVPVFDRHLATAQTRPTTAPSWALLHILRPCRTCSSDVSGAGVFSARGAGARLSGAGGC